MPFLTSKNNDLQYSGPMIEVTVVPPKAVTEQYNRENKPVPSQKVIALIDTGASCTCISRLVVEKLKLIPFDVQKIHTAGGIVQQLLYDAGVMLPISQSAVINVQAPCADLSEQPFQVLIGRDVLEKCTLFYNGPENTFTLHF